MKSKLFGLTLRIFIILTLIIGYLPALSIPTKAAGAPYPTETLTWDSDISALSGIVEVGGKYYSANSYTTYNAGVFNVSDKVTDPAKQAAISNVTLVSNQGEITATCTTTQCDITSGAIYGIEQPVTSSYSRDAGRFDWWRNGPGGSRAWYWTYDRSGDGATITATPPTGTGGIDPQASSSQAHLYPQSDTINEFIDIDTAGTTWDANGTPLPASAVALTSTNITASGDIVYSVTGSSKTGSVIRINYDAGPFDSGGIDIVPHAADYPDAKGLRWNGNFRADFTGKTYTTKLSWTLTVDYGDGICTPGTTGCPTPTPDCTSDPTLPGCTTPPTPTPPPGPTLACTPVIGPATKGTIKQDAVMDPVASGELRADLRDGKRFDVGLGIPTSESLYANVFGLSYLFQNKFAPMTGQVTYTVTVTKLYHKTWTTMAGDPPHSVPHSKDVRVTEQKTVTRTFSYWQIDNLEVYKLDKATVSNYALGGQGGTVTLNAAGGYVAPTLDSDNKDAVDTHVHPQPCSGKDLGTQNVSGGSSEPSTPSESSLFQSTAEGQVKENKVNNDYVQFNGATIMDKGQVDKTAPVPGTIPHPTQISRDVLYGKDYVISNSLVNKANQPTTGVIYYPLIPKNIKGGSNKNYPVNGMNTVTVHTPVVMYPSITDDAAHNQKTVPTAGKNALILDRPFTVTVPTTGQHNAYPGFGGYGVTNGYGEYAKYTKKKEVQFEFDVWTADKSAFYPKGTWIDIPVPNLYTTFILPTWVDEGYYTVYFRSFTINHPSGFTTETAANFGWPNHVATNTLPVEVIGRMYDFHITDIGDPNWETVFRASKGSSQPSGNTYWVGPNGIDNAPQPTASWPFQLPIMRGSHPVQNFKSVSVKTGYNFKFDLKTKGNMFGNYDAIRITPRFYFQDNDPSTPANRIPVDLYYHSDTQRFIKIGSSADVERRDIALNTRLRNVPQSDINNTAGSLYDMFAASGGWGLTKPQYIANYQKRATETTYTGGYDIQMLSSPLRTFIRPWGDKPWNANATDARVNASIQQWYGEYSLPAAAYVVPQGTDLVAYGRTNTLDDQSPIFLKNGFITVNFDLETIQNADLGNPHLQYIHGPLDNQWWNMESYDGHDGSRDHYVTDAYGVTLIVNDGDVVLYHADQSSYDDYDSMGTH
jgi:hypothetical protein